MIKILINRVLVLCCLLWVAIPDESFGQSKIWLGVEASYNPTFSMRGDRWRNIGIPVLGAYCMEAKLKGSIGKRLVWHTGVGIELIQINKPYVVLRTSNIASGYFLYFQKEGATHTWTYTQTNSYIALDINYLLLKVKNNFLYLSLGIIPTFSFYNQERLKPYDNGRLLEANSKRFQVESLSRFRLGASYLINLKKGFQLEANLGTWIYNFQFRQIAIHLGLSLYKQL